LTDDTPQRRPQRIALTAEELEECWDKLANFDLPFGFPQSPLRLRTVSEQFVALLQERLKPVVAAKAAAPGHDPEVKRALGAVYLLEMIGTAEARALLRKIAAGALGASLTGRAEAALKQLDNLPKGDRDTPAARVHALAMRLRQQPAPKPLSGEETEVLWVALAGDDAATAYRAAGILGAMPGQTVALLQQRLRSVPPPNPRVIAQLVADLDSKSFAIREKAFRKLEQLGQVAESALREAVVGTSSLEQRRRAERLLRILEMPLSAETLRALRAIELLERIGNAGARRVLESVAAGVAEVRLAREARASLERLTRLRRGP
jgi:hypothetical protein